jgi:ribonuclease PH
MREDRRDDQLRPTQIEAGFNIHAEGSALINMGDTRVLCTASVEDRQPPFLRDTNRGWVTAEYGMLPRSTHTRSGREAARGRQGGRTLEIQRLIGRSMRAVVDLDALGPCTIHLDCDVLQADGGTRCAAITGAWVALRQAVNIILADGQINADPITGQVAAVSCGYVGGRALLDLQYSEDSIADMDANFIMIADGGIVEVQATAETRPVPWEMVQTLKELADHGILELARLQLEAASY